VKSSEVAPDLKEHYKLMADFFKHLSVLSITFAVLGVGLSSNLFTVATTKIPLHLAILVLVVASILSLLGQLAYIDVFRVPKLLTGSKYYKLAKSTIMPLIFFLVGVAMLVLYISFALLGI
jgi:hypothetical protein